MIVALSSVLVTLIEIRQHHPVAIALWAAVAVAASAGFVATQRYARAPLVASSLVRRPDFLAATVAAFGTGAGVIALMSFGATFMVTALGLSTFEAGGMLVLWSGTSAVTALLSSRLPRRLHGQVMLAIGLFGVAAGMLAVSWLSSTSSPWRMVPGLLVTGMASGLLNAGLGRQAVASAPDHMAAVGTGANNTARYLGSSIGITLVSLIVIASGPRVPGLIAGWNAASLLTAAISAVAATVVIVLGRRTGPAR